MRQSIQSNSVIAQMKHKALYQILFIGLLFVSAFCSASRQLTTFTIHYADPAQIKTAVRSLLSKGSSVSLYQNRLVLNATEAEIVKTQALLQQLDVGGRQLLISVKTSGHDNQQHAHASVSARVEAGPGVETRTRTTVRVQQYQSNRNQVAGQGVRATEGRPAFVSVGGIAPISSYRTTADGRLIQQHDAISATSGFYATAWVNEHSVRVSIDQQRQQFQGRVIEGQQLRSEVTGTLGSWIPVGMISASNQQTGSGILQRQSGHTDSGETVYLKVELLN